MISKPTLIEATGLSEAWLAALKGVLQMGDIAPLTVTFPAPGADGNWDKSDVRSDLDAILSQKGKFSSATVANTIFPVSLWDPNQYWEYRIGRRFRLTWKLATCSS